MINGIDIFHGDTVSATLINSLIRSENLYFVFIKSGTGAQGLDAKFVTYWEMCRSAGLLCGAYHWFWPSSQPTQQALSFINQYRKVSRAGVLPPVIDIEWTWNAGAAQTDRNELWGKVPANERIGLIREYCSQVEATINVRPTIYTAFSFWEEFITPFASAEDNAFFAGCLLWNADPNNRKRIARPWTGLPVPAAFVQTHFGESGTAGDPFSRLDQDVYSGSLKGLLNSSVPGLTFMKGFPFSNIVKDFQLALQNAGWLHDEADGFFGKNTMAAVTKFQEFNGLTGNGVIDAQTWNKLLP
ncbi:GH25 family lysozyme [Deminuibacter soli]|uniref:Peptidoglycan binding-like domain-containing protein n=1 Tax=Deminuibacter soli TaxID=2291815 RepID=A0A3E1NQ70_9BACT|nr:GH25 family lysozyme [Deminuibacter soli]RFM30099.1 hypothetical protein DXN05_03755 [Deminuibacter soli]